MQRFLLPLFLAACGPKSTEVETADVRAPEAERVRMPFGPAHEATGDRYDLSEEPQVANGVLRVPVRHAKDCDPAEFHLEQIAESPNSPRTVAVALVKSAGGTYCKTDSTRVLEFDLVKELGADCYDTLVLEAAGETPRVIPLRGLGCAEDTTAQLHSGVYTLDEYRARWGEPYRIAGDPVIENGKILANARYTGGCGSHSWTVRIREYRPDKRLPIASADLVHNARGERCQALEVEAIEVDVRPWLEGQCPAILELHVPDVLPTGDTFDREVLIKVDPETDCGPATP